MKEYKIHSKVGKKKEIKGMKIDDGNLKRLSGKAVPDEMKKMYSRQANQLTEDEEDTDDSEV